MNSASSNLKVAMSESSTNSTQSNGYCFCGMKIKRRTSGTDLNPGRRFEACDQNRNRQTRHHFFEWLDNETCPRGKEVLPGLLRRLRGMEEEIRARDEQLRLVEVEKKKLEEKVCVVIEGKKELEWSRQRQLKLGFALILSWCLFVIFVMSRKI
ncbi:uncharacterized protein At4g04775-like [Prunus dulcis]|uniref:uncharacterized protein At4g04775-like n=1 Tax=Prunus dulcis TaxID=3755 RepID=UPI00148241AA|nr:uncharacterized protein At4g04775-like [Prunus dulcis]